MCCLVHTIDPTVLQSFATVFAISYTLPHHSYRIVFSLFSFCSCSYRIPCALVLACYPWLGFIFVHPIDCILRCYSNSFCQIEVCFCCLSCLFRYLSAEWKSSNFEKHEKCLYAFDWSTHFSRSPSLSLAFLSC